MSSQTRLMSDRHEQIVTDAITCFDRNNCVYDCTRMMNKNNDTAHFDSPFETMPRAFDLRSILIDVRVLHARARAFVQNRAREREKTIN